MVQFIAHYQHRLTEGGRFNPAQMDNLTISQHYSTAVESLKYWPRGFHQLLSQYLVNPMSSRGHFGINKHYRDIHEKLYQQQANNGIKRLKAAFDQYIDLNWPTALQTKNLTRLDVTTEDRPLISQKEALAILECREPRLKKLIEQRKLTLQAFKGKAYFNRAEVQALANLYQENWSFAQACKETELSRHQLLQLLRSKLIKTLQRPNHQNRDWLIDKQAWIKQIQSFQKKAQPDCIGYTLAGFQKQGFDIVKVFKLLKKGSLTYEFNPNTAKPFSIKQLRQINTHTKKQHQG
ncbi:hypothetical protein [Gilvimarinus algae]|uniref:Uncharacterized protein n=1 Tax=Gilvimarinus algae TaxID=3058037 RepID=A0ABT8T9U5_9GAMM|nr:hypothetical protein [Gilvimarinus sp. SDUM040014]MDO3380894.1 hypothetical protein [Gilvimarinus sp. SDUM040014]